MQDIFRFWTNITLKFCDTYFLDTKALWDQGQPFRGRQEFWLYKNVNAEIWLSLKELNLYKQWYWQSLKTNLARTVPVENMMELMVDDCWLSWNWPELAGNAAYITPQPQPGSLRVSRDRVCPAREKSAGKQFVLLESNIYGDDVAKYTTTPFSSMLFEKYRKRDLSRHHNIIWWSGGPNIQENTWYFFTYLANETFRFQITQLCLLSHTL